MNFELQQAIAEVAEKKPERTYELYQESPTRHPVEEHFDFLGRQREMVPEEFYYGKEAERGRHEVGPGAERAPDVQLIESSSGMGDMPEAAVRHAGNFY